MFYIFLIAVLNIGLGFAAAVYLGRGCNRPAAASPSRENVSLDTQADGLDNLGADPREDHGNDADDLVGAMAGKHAAVDDEFSTDLDALFQ